MWINWKRFTCGALLLASLALLLSGCGGLGGSTAQGVTATKTISGIVSDPDTGFPVKGATVKAYAIGADGTEGSTPISIPASDTTGTTGAYTLKIPADYTGSVMVVADVSGGTVMRSLARLLAITTPKYVKAAVPQNVVASASLPPVMVSFATNTVVEFVKQNNSAAFTTDNVRRATLALETFFGPNFTQTPPPASATDANTSKAQQDLIVSIQAINSVISGSSTTSIATIVAGLTSSTGLGSVADSIKTQIAATATTLAAAGTVPPQYQPSPTINAAISNVQSAPVVVNPALLADTVAPTAPANLQGKAEAPRSVRLQWDAATDSGTGVAGYLVCRTQDTSGAYATIDTVPATQTVYYDLSAQPQIAYSYKIVAFDGAHNLSDATAPFAVTTPAATDSIPPTVPAGLVSRGVTSSEVGLQWQQSTKTLADKTVIPATSYNVYRDTQLIATVTQTFFTDNTVSAGTAYTYWVRASDANGNLSAASQSLTLRTAAGAGTAPAAPGALNVAATPGPYKVALQWVASSSTVSGYNVYRDGSLIASGIAGTSYTDTTVVPQSSYAYTVKAYRVDPTAGLLESAATAPLPVTTPADSSVSSATPAMPKNLTATVGSNSVALSWSAGDSITVGYDVLRSDDSGAHYAKIATVKTPGYTDTTVHPNTSTYVYLVVAYSSAGIRSSAIAVGPVTTPPAPDLTDTTPPTPPTGLQGAADANSGVVSLSWTASTKSTGDKVVAGYLVYRNGMQLAQVTSGTSFTDSSVAAGTSYTYTVRAYDNPGNVSGDSNSVKITTLPAATGIAGRITLNGVGLSGSMVSITGSASQSVVTDANGYYLFNNVPDGSYTVTAVTSGNILFTPVSRTVSVSGAKVSGQDFAAVLSGTVTGGVTYPEGTIIGGITYPTGVVIGGVYYPTATVIGGVTYPTGTVIGGTVFPNGVVIGGVTYGAGTVVGGIAFPVGAITSGYTWPTGTVIGGVIYPTGTVVGGVIYPTGSATGTVIFPTGTVGGTATYPTGVVVGGTVYPAGVVTAGVSFPTGSAVGVILYPTGSVSGGYSYPTGSVSGGFTYPTGVAGAGVVYPTGSVSVGTIYPSGGLSGSLSYPGGSVAALLSW